MNLQIHDHAIDRRPHLQPPQHIFSGPDPLPKIKQLRLGLAQGLHHLIDHRCPQLRDPKLRLGDFLLGTCDVGDVSSFTTGNLRGTPLQRKKPGFFSKTLLQKRPDDLYFTDQKPELLILGLDLAP